MRKSYSVLNPVKGNKTEYFPTPESIKQDLLNLADIDFSDKVIFDPCAGDGALTRGIKAKKIIQWDLEPRADNVEQHDALLEEWPKASEVDVIVCNPPFTKTKEFYERSKGYRHVFFITTTYRARRWSLTNYKQSVSFPGVFAKVCLLYIDKDNPNKVKLPLKVYEPLQLQARYILRLLRETVFKDAKFVSLEEAEALQGTHFVVRSLVGSKATFKCTWLVTKERIEKRYEGVDKWLKSDPEYHRLVAIPKDAYDSFDTNTVIEWLKKNDFQVPDNLKYFQGIDCIDYLISNMFGTIHFWFDRCLSVK